MFVFHLRKPTARASNLVIKSSSTQPYLLVKRLRTVQFRTRQSTTYHLSNGREGGGGDKKKKLEEKKEGEEGNRAGRICKAAQGDDILQPLQVTTSGDSALKMIGKPRR